MKRNPDPVVLCLPRRACSRIVLCGAIILTILIPSVPLRAQAQSRITQASVSGTAVSIQGVNLGTAVTAITLGTTTVLNPFVNPTGDLVTGTLASPLAPGTYLLSVISTATNTGSCASAQPAADWVCVNGGWVPSNHPLATPSVQALTFLVTVGGSGPEGPAGPQGPAGSVGATGATGPVGPAGLTGATGPIGTPGPAGPQGLGGVQGPAGPAGIQGVIGPAGPAGPQGLTGPSGAGGTTARDANNITLGRIVEANRYGVRVITSTGYLVDINWDGTFPIAQIYYTGAACTGTAILNSGGPDPDKIYGKTLVFSGSFNTLMAPSSVTSGVSTGGGSVPVQSIDNPDCGPAAAGNGWTLTPVTAAAAGLPTTIAGPLSIP